MPSSDRLSCRANDQELSIMVRMPPETTSGHSKHFLNELRTTFDQRAAQPAIIYRERTITYGDLDRRARRCAALLQTQGVVPGDRVVLLTADKLPFLLTHLGALYAGAVPLPL